MRAYSIISGVRGRSLQSSRWGFKIKVGKQNESGYQAIATLEFLSFKQTEILNAKRNMPYNMYALGYHFHKHVMYSTPNIMLKSKQIHENILCKETYSLLNRRKIQR